MPLTAENLPWWRKTVVYQIYPRSFFDSNGDGIGDLTGIIAKLDHLQTLGVETLWISPFFSSPQRDFGYDISDFRGIASDYGSMRDCEALIEAAHSRDMKIVLDMVLNHTSDQHPWFLESRSNRNNPKRDWYVWRDGRKPRGAAPPNNWRNMLTGRGWHYDSATDQWYWAQFLPFQPDLNYRNPEVRAAMLGTIRFWLEKGVDGFRLDIVNALFEDAEFRDNPLAWRPFPSHDDPGVPFRSTKHTLNHPDTVDFMQELRRTVDKFDTPERFLVGEVIAPIETARRFCANGTGLHLVFLFNSLSTSLNASSLGQLIDLYGSEFPDPLIPTWVFSNHDQKRRISRLGGSLEQAKLNVALQLTAQGVPFIYYGEEIGMVQHRLPVRKSKDALVSPYRRLPQPLFNLLCKIVGQSLNRDECRTPMQWNDGPTAGFCPVGTTPWLPVGPDHTRRNVSVQENDPDSLLWCYRRFLEARRKTPALHAGTMRLIRDQAAPSCLLVYERAASLCGENQEARVYLNCGGGILHIPPPPASFRLLVSTNANRRQDRLETMELAPWEGVVFVTDRGNGQVPR